MPYKVLTGDFNASGDTLAPFLTNCDLVNGYDGLWYTSCETYGTNGDGKPSENSDDAIDNIIISKNFEIVNTRLVYHNGLSDHYPLYADLKMEALEDDLQDLVNTCNYVEENYTATSFAPYQSALDHA